MFSVLVLGLLIGMKHALEADHVAAVATLASRGRSAGEVIRCGVAWGFGHTATLFGIASLALFFNVLVPETLARTLEFAVGIMLVVLGLDVLRRLIRDRVHFHAHRHHDLGVHVHAHAHAGQEVHDAAAHAHRHPENLPIRSFVVGLVHGLAGSAALVILAVAATDSLATGLAYLVLFGLGSTVGMAVLSFAIALPLRYSQRHMARGFRALQGGIAALTIVVGARIIAETGLISTLAGL